LSERTLLLGGSGFLGSYVARSLLDAGHEVSIYDASGPPAEASFVLGPYQSKVVRVIGSIEDRPHLERVMAGFDPDNVVHLAGVVDPLRLISQPWLALEVNVAGTVNALEASRTAGVSLFVYISSIGVLPGVRYEPIDGDHPVILAGAGPATGPYGAAKLAGEAFCLAYQDQYDLQTRIVRPSAVYGFGMRPHSANYIKNILEPAIRGESVRLPSGGPLTRDYTHVADIADLVVALIARPAIADRVFFGATGEPLVSAAEVAEMVRRLVPDSAISIGMSLSEEDEVESGFRGRLSIENAREQLGWTPSYPQVADGLAEYARQYSEFIGGGAPLRS
jgi:nucleoside-diphosphate-sugar epimerase